MAIWIIGLLFASGCIALVIYERGKSRRIFLELKRRELDFFTQRFGTRLMISTLDNCSNQNSVLWYRVLREHLSDGRLPEGDGSLLFLKSDVLLKDHDGYFWHCMLKVIEMRDKPEFLITHLSELRARKAIFNYPKIYHDAFGECPDISQLKNLSTDISSTMQTRNI